MENHMGWWLLNYCQVMANCPKPLLGLTQLCLLGPIAILWTEGVRCCSGTWNLQSLVPQCSRAQTFNWKSPSPCTTTAYSLTSSDLYSKNRSLNMASLITPNQTISHTHLCKFFFKNWSIIALQCCVSSCCTMKWILYVYTYIPSLMDLPPKPPSHPSRTSQSTELGFLWLWLRPWTPYCKIQT